MMECLLEEPVPVGNTASHISLVDVVEFLRLWINPFGFNIVDDKLAIRRNPESNIRYIPEHY